jgi:hypothetical protein
MKKVSLILFFISLSFIGFSQKNDNLRVDGTFDWASADGIIYHQEAVSYRSIIMPTKSGSYNYNIMAIDADGDVLMSVQFKGSAIFHPQKNTLEKPQENMLDLLPENKAFRIVLKGGKEIE